MQTITPFYFNYFFFFNDTATTEIYTLSLHDALPILKRCRERAIGELDLGEDWQAAQCGGLQQGMAVRHSRARDHEIYALQKLRVVATETPLDRETAEQRPFFFEPGACLIREQHLGSLT